MASNSLAKRVVNVINLGRMGYMGAFDIQNRYKRMHQEEMEGKSTQAQNVLLLVEHNPVYTVGVRGQGYTLQDEERLRKLGAEFYHTNRGGLITFHGPGQLVAYPVLNLCNFITRPSLPWYVSALENTIINTCKKFGITAEASTVNRGVWVNDRKIAAIGVNRSRIVTTHGCSLNCNTDLEWFKHIDPCGIEDKEVTSLSKEVDTNITIEKAIAPFLSSFQESFDCDFEFSGLEHHELESIIQHTEGLNQLNVPKSKQSSVRMMSSLAAR
ncbi:hypothetical protein LOTGIDRAFT_235450 [Lottia gigantea]|uniref:lipoyl(octanoyl) transferase n=1 Tax=Lottia gigantea TaxID=225164 RepID=V3ZZJ1_LOTGI|nr:hypothetical protein LOTGIDRAFT_235450 [Lottia gigantea]ESO86406.1 hypothetical protein LOTGIDRAFT_235450 [Lottia gigantea]